MKNHIPIRSFLNIGFVTAVFILFGMSASAEIVTTGILRGPRPTARVLKSLAASGVKTIVNLQGGDLNGSFEDNFVKLFEPGETPAMIA